MDQITTITTNLDSTSEVPRTSSLSSLVVKTPLPCSWVVDPPQIGTDPEARDNTDHLDSECELKGLS